MPKQRASTLSGLICLLVERFLPEAQQNYVLPNLKASEWYRQYNSFVPDYLRGRPRSIILHCLDRQSRSNTYSDGDVSVGEKEGLFRIHKKDGSSYLVDFGQSSKEDMPSCSCKDWTKWHIPCKHFFAVFRLKQGWGWDALPQVYKQSAYLSTDNDATDAYFAQFSRISGNAEDALQPISESDNVAEPVRDPETVIPSETSEHQQQIPIKVRIKIIKH